MGRPTDIPSSYSIDEHGLAVERGFQAMTCTGLNDCAGLDVGESALLSASGANDQHTLQDKSQAKLQAKPQFLPDGTRRKFFFFDYDGTLAIPLTRDIPQSARDTIEQLRKRGHFVALATGRLQINALNYIQTVGITNLVADGGYSVTINGELEWMIPLDLENVKRCLRILDAHNIPWAVTTNNEMMRYSSNPRFAEISGDYYVPTSFDPHLTIDGLTQVYKVYIPWKEEDDAKLIATGALDMVPHIRYNADTVFIEPMDKQLGIRRMMRILQAPTSDVVVFGDSYNDVSMFIPEWTCIAMGNAREVVKKRATYITSRVDDDGIMNACKHFGWID